LTSRTWGRILNELADAVYVDLVLWVVQDVHPELSLTTLAEELTRTAFHGGRLIRPGRYLGRHHGLEEPDHRGSHAGRHDFPARCRVQENGCDLAERE
jgi:hypothetical protein